MGVGGSKSKSNWNWLPVLGLPLLAPLVLVIVVKSHYPLMNPLSQYLWLMAAAIIGAIFLVYRLGWRMWMLALCYLMLASIVMFYACFLYAGVFYNDYL